MSKNKKKKKEKEKKGGGCNCGGIERKVGRVEEWESRRVGESRGRAGESGREREIAGRGMVE
jgi:hypothetical protein